MQLKYQEHDLSTEDNLQGHQSREVLWIFYITLSVANKCFQYYCFNKTINFKSVNNIHLPKNVYFSNVKIFHGIFRSITMRNIQINFNICLKCCFSTKNQHVIVIEESARFPWLRSEDIPLRSSSHGLRIPFTPYLVTRIVLLQSAAHCSVVLSNLGFLTSTMINSNAVLSNAPWISRNVLKPKVVFCSYIKSSILLIN